VICLADARRFWEAAGWTDFRELQTPADHSALTAVDPAGVLRLVPSISNLNEAVPAMVRIFHGQTAALEIINPGLYYVRAGFSSYPSAPTPHEAIAVACLKFSEKSTWSHAR
jgi:hypothetical protein